MSPELPTDSIDDLILTAFSVALAKLDSPLPSQLQEQINQVGESLAKSETDVIVDLEDIAAEYPELNELYQAVAKTLQRHYQTQERNKSAPPPGREPRPPEDEYLQNYLAPDDIDVVQILRADDSRKVAQEQLQQAEAKGKYTDFLLPPIL
jgi:hypothetical protein